MRAAATLRRLIRAAPRACAGGGAAPRGQGDHLHQRCAGCGGEAAQGCRASVERGGRCACAPRAPGADAPRPRRAVGNPHALGQKPLSFNRQVGCRCSRRAKAPAAPDPGGAQQRLCGAPPSQPRARVATRCRYRNARCRWRRTYAAAWQRQPPAVALSGRCGGKLTRSGAAGAVARHRAVPAGPPQGPGAVLQGAGPPACAAAAPHARRFTCSRQLRASVPQEAVDRARETLTKVRASRGRRTRAITTGADLRFPRSSCKTDSRRRGRLLRLARRADDPQGGVCRLRNAIEVLLGRLMRARLCSSAPRLRRTSRTATG